MERVGSDSIDDFKLDLNYQEKKLRNFEEVKRSSSNQFDLSGYLKIDVTDTGMGISRKGLRKLFQNFGKLKDRNG